MAKFHVGDRVTVNPKLNRCLADAWDLPCLVWTDTVTKVGYETYYVGGWYVPFALVVGEAEDPATELLKRVLDYDAIRNTEVYRDIMDYLLAKEKQR